jgi:hypothetical protein
MTHEDKWDIVSKLEEAYKQTRLPIRALIYVCVPVGVEDGREIHDEYVNVFVEGKDTPWLSINVTADSGAALIYDVAKAICRRT